MAVSDFWLLMPHVVGIVAFVLAVFPKNKKSMQSLSGLVVCMSFVLFRFHQWCTLVETYRAEVGFTSNAESMTAHDVRSWFENTRWREHGECFDGLNGTELNRFSGFDFFQRMCSDCGYLHDSSSNKENNCDSVALSAWLAWHNGQQESILQIAVVIFTLSGMNFDAKNGFSPEINDHVVLDFAITLTLALFCVWAVFHLLYLRLTRTGEPLCDEQHVCIFDLDFLPTRTKTLFSHELTYKRILVRGCYKDIFETVQQNFQRHNYQTIQGTPGIGKSLFGVLYILELTRLIKAREEAWYKNITHILYEHCQQEGNYTCYYVYDVWTGLWKKNDEQNHRRFFDRYCDNVFLLKDGACRYDPDERKGRFLWISSPRSRHMRKLEESMSANSVIMGPWDDTDIKKAVDYNCINLSMFCDLKGTAEQIMKDFLEDTSFTKEDLADQKITAEPVKNVRTKIFTALAKDLGYVGRRLCHPTKHYRKQKLAIADLKRGEKTFQSLQTLAEGKSLDLQSIEWAHALVTMIPDDSDMNYIQVPASTRVSRAISLYIKDYNLQQVENSLGILQGTQLGIQFECYAHKRLCSEQMFEAESLDGKPPLRWKGCTRAEMFDAKDLNKLTVNPTVYYQPSQSNFPVVDSFTGSMMFQMTVRGDRKHGIKCRARDFVSLGEKLQCSLNGPIPLVFVVHESIYETFQRQDFVDSNNKVFNGQGGFQNLLQYKLKFNKIY